MQVPFTLRFCHNLSPKVCFFFSLFCGVDCITFMEVEERNVSSGYAKPPWIFKGRQVTSFNWVAFQKCLFVAFNLASFFAFSA